MPRLRCASVNDCARVVQPVAPCQLRAQPLLSLSGFRVCSGNLASVGTTRQHPCCHTFYTQSCTGRNVERMLDIFVNMNLEMQKTGNLSASISKDELLKLVRCFVHKLFGFVRPVPVTSYVPCRCAGPFTLWSHARDCHLSSLHHNHHAICNFTFKQIPHPVYSQSLTSGIAGPAGGAEQPHIDGHHHQAGPAGLLRHRLEDQPVRHFFSMSQIHIGMSIAAHHAFAWRHLGFNTVCCTNCACLQGCSSTV